MDYTPLLIAVVILLTGNAVVSACIWSNVGDIRTVVYSIKRELKRKDEQQ